MPAQQSRPTTAYGEPMVRRTPWGAPIRMSGSADINVNEFDEDSAAAKQSRDGFSDIKLSKDSADVLGLLCQVIRQGGSPLADQSVKEVARAVKLLWGEAGVKAVEERGDVSDDEAATPLERYREMERKATNPGNAKVQEPDIATMSLRGMEYLERTGRCTQREYVRMSHPSTPADKRQRFVDSRVDIPAGTMMPASVSGNESAWAAWILGRGPRPS